MMHRNKLILALTALAWLTALPAMAQDEEDEDARRAEAVRAKMYDSLAREVTALERQSNALKLVVKLVQPTVVHIEAEKTEPASVHYGRKEHIEEAGSGCIVKINGKDYVITNRHVIKAADPKNIKIRLADGRQINPTKYPWSDPETDIAVMAVEAPGLIAARLGDSSNLEIGDFVLAVGSPFGLSHSITFGIVSATGRWDLKLENGVTVRLPEFGEDAAIAEVVALDAEHGLLSRDLAAVDMRLEDRVVVKLTPEAVTRREAALKDMKKKSGAAGKKI